MIIAEFIALITAFGAPAQPAVDTRPAVSRVNAMIATQQAPAARDLTKPAVFIKDGAKGAIVGRSGPGPIA